MRAPGPGSSIFLTITVLVGVVPAAMALAQEGSAVQERTVGENDRMRYVLIGPAGGAAATMPEARHRLLLVLPGGDGGADFAPFVTSIAERAMPDGYVVAQLIAPQWRDDEDRIVWPTAQSRDAKAEFITEQFIDAVVEDVKGQVRIDPRHVYALGWSSGGPPVYAAAMRRDTPITGAFVAMSVFKPDQLPPARFAAGRSFYILHSPQDFIAMRFPELARDTLAKAGATVELRTYEGGHGWHGDVFGNIRRGVEWLEQNADAGAAAERERSNP